MLLTPVQYLWQKTKKNKYEKKKEKSYDKLASSYLNKNPEMSEREDFYFDFNPDDEYSYPGAKDLPEYYNYSVASENAIKSTKLYNKFCTKFVKKYGMKGERYLKSTGLM